MSPQLHRPTVAACGVIAWAAAVCAHQGAHALAVLAAGGTVEAVTALGLMGRWSARRTPDALLVHASGTVANAALVGLSWWVLSRRPGPGSVGAVAWLVFVANGWIAAGHLVLSPLLGVGDWIAIVDLFANRGPMRASVLVTGLFVCGVLWKGTYESLAPVAGGGATPARLRTARSLTRTAWLSGTVVVMLSTVVTALMAPSDGLLLHTGLSTESGLASRLTVALLASATGIGAATFPAVLAVSKIEERPVRGPILSIERSPLLIVAGVIAGMVMVAVLGAAGGTGSG